MLCMGGEGDAEALKIYARAYEKDSIVYIQKSLQVERLLSYYNRYINLTEMVPN